ncbi:MAG: hypothetical protein L3J75_13760 [Methylococcaceae bacterium]|nr:hypothetical protein [Methylococcaceae bacterium]
MKKQGIPILLIIMMLITPVAEAFDHCAGMGLSGYLSATLSSESEYAAHSEHQKMYKESLNSQTDMDCNSDSDCTFHFCGGYGITSSISSVKTVPFSYYSVFEYVSPYSTALSPDLRPPIFVL